MTTVRRPSREELVARRDEILRSLQMSDDELAARVHSGTLNGLEWSAAAEIEEINYLLEGV